jgi:riboflavin biosynthesis protein RibD
LRTFDSKATRFPIKPGTESENEMWSKADAYYMLRALRLAGRGAGLVSPNPMVGAVVVRDGRIVGEGFHRYEQVKHAETIALEMAGEHSRGATLYCSLEPCSHFGRTTPCADAVVEAGIVRAVIATPDSDPRVSGRGIEKMMRAEIEIESGLYEREARTLNEIYFKFVTTRLPFLHAVMKASQGEWTPSKQFRKTAGIYDAVILGGSEPINRLAIENSLGRARHRPLLVVGARQELAQTAALLPSVAKVSRVEMYEIEKEKPLRPVLEALAEGRITSALVLAQTDEARREEITGLSDKLTIIASANGFGLSQEFAPDKGAKHPYMNSEAWHVGETLEITCSSRRPGGGLV